MGSYIFLNCKELETVNFATTITSMGMSVFNTCLKLTSVDLSALTGLTAVPSRAFYNCPLTTVLLPEGLKTIGDSAFYGNRFAGTVKIPGAVETISGVNTFYYTPSGAVIDMTDHQPGSIAGAPWSAQEAIIRWHPDAYAIYPTSYLTKQRDKLPALKRHIRATET